MKITFGGEMTMSIIDTPYESLKVSSTLIIEKEAEAFSDEEIERLQTKANKKLKEDVMKKMESIAEAKKESKKHLNDVLGRV